jgi:hypothetical protein
MIQKQLSKSERPPGEARRATPTAPAVLKNGGLLAGGDLALDLPAFGGITELAEAPHLLGLAHGAGESRVLCRTATLDERIWLPARPKT